MVINIGLLDTLHIMLRGIQEYMKKYEAPQRHYYGKPRHMRKAARHYNGNLLEEAVILNFGMKDCCWGRCRMCGLSTRAEAVTEDAVKSELEEIAKLPQLRSAASIFVSPYSFFSDAEMPPELRKKAYGIIDSLPNLEYAVFMTRADYVSEEKLLELRNHLKKQKVIVWMGAETSNSVISRYCIDKGYCWEDVEKASELMKRHGIKTGVWVLLKPPFVSEREGIGDAVQTIRKGLNNGYYIRLMPAEVMEFTITQLLFEIGKYRPAKLWSVIEVLKRFSPEEHLRIDVSGPYFEREWSVVPIGTHSSKILEFPSNCLGCSEYVLQAILDYNKKKEIGVFDGLECKCKDEWVSELNKNMPTLEERLIGDFSDVINHFIVTRRGRNENV